MYFPPCSDDFHGNSSHCSASLGLLPVLPTLSFKILLAATHVPSGHWLSYRSSVLSLSFEKSEYYQAIVIRNIHDWGTKTGNTHAGAIGDVFLTDILEFGAAYCIT